MNKESFVISIDQGTTSCRAILFNSNSEILQVQQQEFRQIYPKPGWVEHDPMEILQVQKLMVDRILQSVNPNAIVAIGITNQRETVVVWDKNTGKPVYNAIVWQDTRTSKFCSDLKKSGHEAVIRAKTGLVIDSYFSGTKLRWVLDNVPEAKSLNDAGNLMFGTIDTWLIWNLSEEKTYATDFSNASRTMLFNIEELCWDQELIELLGVAGIDMPKVMNSAGQFGHYKSGDVSIPISGVAGDQQAALFGQLCFNEGAAKNTYGTGCFMLMNTGCKPIPSNSGLLTTIAWCLDGKVTYALEGSVFIAGAAIQWLRDGLELFGNAKDTEMMAREIKDSHEVYFVPAFAGLGAPYWDMQARGAIFGLTRDAGKNHITKAALDALAYQTRDVLDAMEKDSGSRLSNLAVDGGASDNDYLMQFQSDILGVRVDRPKIIESTALGAAFLAGIGVGLWSVEDLLDRKQIESTFESQMSEKERTRLYAGWQKAVKRTGGWLD